MHHEMLVQMIRDKGLSVSHQRVAMLHYLMESEEHPTVEMIYNDLRTNGYPTLSRATVYNNLKAFVDAGLVNELELGDHEHRYDANTRAHGHCYCRQCVAILNVALPETLTEELVESIRKEAPNFYPEQPCVNFTGLCSDCRNALA